MTDDTTVGDFVIHRCQNFDRNSDQVVSCLRTISGCIYYKNTALKRINAFLQLFPDFEFEREIIFTKRYIKEDNPDKALEIISDIKKTLCKRHIGQQLISKRLRSSKDMGDLKELNNDVLDNIFSLSKIDNKLPSPPIF